MAGFKVGDKVLINNVPEKERPYSKYNGSTGVIWALSSSNRYAFLIRTHDGKVMSFQSSELSLCNKPLKHRRIWVENSKGEM